MKKAIVLLLALCLTGIAFAEGETWTIEGDASVTWGYNLNDDSHGFLNDASFTLTIPLVAETTKATEGLEGVYGWIEFSEFEAVLEGELDDADATVGYTAPSVTAKVIAGSLWVGIYSEPDFGYNMAAMFEPMSVDEWEDKSWESGTGAVNAVGGISLGYDTEMVKFQVNLGSDGSYDSAAGAGSDTTTFVPYTAPAGVTETVAANTYFDFTAGTWVGAGADLTDGEVYLTVETTAGDPATTNNVDAKYMIGADVTLVPMEMVEVVIGVFADLWDPAEGANKGVGLGLTLKPMEGVEVGAGLDVVINGENDPVMDVSLAATYTMANKDSATLGAYVVFANDFSTGLPALLAGVEPFYFTQDTETMLLNLGFRVTEDTAEGFVPGLGGGAYVNALRLLDEDTTSYEGVPVLLGANVEYEYAIEEGKTVKPYAGFDYGLLFDEDGAGDPIETSNGLHFVVGVDINVIAKTTFNVQFEGGAMGDDEYLFVSPVFHKDVDKGLFTVSCTVEY